MRDTVINIYSDENNHLKDDNQGNFMVIGSVWCESDRVKQISDAVRKVKEYHGISKSSEIKWTKLSPGNVEFYSDLVKLFFKTDDLNFRAVVIPKNRLDHELFSQTDDEFYYKMQYLMITNIVKNNNPASFKVYIDYKDNWSHYRSKKLEQYLSHKIDFALCKFQAQPVRSHESELIQLADLLIGATSYKSNKYKNEDPERPKRRIVDLIEKSAIQRLNQSSPVTSEKMNIFLWGVKD